MTKEGAIGRRPETVGPFRTVVFDCDSTLSAIEGLEVLAAGRRGEVVALTEAAMRGEVPLEEVYGRRLDLVRPTREQVASVGRRYVESLVPDARPVVSALRTAGVRIRIVSAGLLPAVRTLARSLGLSDDAVAAVDVDFDDRGRYAGYDRSSPLARSDGKRVVLERWAPELPRPILFVGDGANDLSARMVVDAFVAFAGVVDRPRVTEAADVVIRARTLAPVLPLALGDRAPRDPEARALFDEGTRLLESS